MISQKNLIIMISNDEKRIRNYIDSSKEQLDLIFIDNISEIITIDEKRDLNDFSIKQNMPKLLGALSNYAYSNNISIVLTNFLTYKNDTLISKWNYHFNKYCKTRLRIIEYKSLLKIQMINDKNSREEDIYELQMG